MDSSNDIKDNKKVMCVLWCFLWQHTFGIHSSYSWLKCICILFGFHSRIRGKNISAKANKNY